MLSDITDMWNLKYDRNGLIHKIETDSQNREQTCGWLPKGEARGMDWEFGLSRCKLSYNKQHE